MKLSDIYSQPKILEGFIPADTMLAIQMLANGTSDNINHKFILARVVNYIKDHPVTTERFRDIGEFTPSAQCIADIKALSAKDLAQLATTTTEIINAALDDIDADGYVNRRVELIAHLKNHAKANA